MTADIIRTLPESVANQIAAGEVIQRPSSVVKELVENAVDAGATSISIVVKDAGRTLVQVIDNGKGMTPNDARMAFDRHATSKISDASDLLALHTMGFRGEALPSIASVAQVDMRTMPRDETMGTRLCIEGQKVVLREACACTPGTNIMVKNLFFHLPARRKFLKKDSVELSHIMHEFERLALVNPSIEFEFVSNDVTLHRLPPCTLKQRIAQLFGKEMEHRIVPVATETPLVRISGFVGLPQYARRRGAHQYFFVNGRNMTHRYFHKALMTCYDNLIAGDSQPSYFVNFEVDPSTIDVNIHPQKYEVKFEHEQSLWQILSAAVREALGKVNAAGALEFDREEAPDIPVFSPDNAATMPSAATNPAYNPFADNDSTDFELRAPAVSPTPRLDFGDGGRGVSAGQYRPSVAVPRDWQKLYENFTSRSADPHGSAINTGDDTLGSSINGGSGRSATPQQYPVLSCSPTCESQAPAPGAVCMQLRSHFVVTSAARGLMIIDQHRAHIRVLYDRFMALLAAGNIASQQLIFPETLTLSASQSVMLESLQPSLATLGFDVTFLGHNSWAINGVPATGADGHAAEMLTHIIADAADSGEASADSLLAPMALSMARAAAVKSGQTLSVEEMDKLIADLFRCVEAAYTPDGLRVFIVIGDDDIARLFA